MTTCEWRYEKTVADKSRVAFSDYDPERVYVWKLHDIGWQDGDKGWEKVIIGGFVVRSNFRKY